MWMIGLCFLLSGILWGVYSTRIRVGSDRAYFEGQYQIGDGEWQNVVEGQHISSTQGDVTLKGQFHMNIPGGEYLGPAEEGVPLAFYINHIHITVQEEGQEAYILDVESEFVGKTFAVSIAPSIQL